MTHHSNYLVKCELSETMRASLQLIWISVIIKSACAGVFDDDARARFARAEGWRTLN
jgi:hypothetical protein